MTAFQRYADLLVLLWLLLVAVRYRRSRIVLTGGLIGIGGYALISLAVGEISAQTLGLEIPDSWPRTVLFAVGWLAFMLAASPLADQLASRLVKRPPTLGAFRVLQQSKANLVIGIAVAWVLGGLLEELVLRGVVLRSVASYAGTHLSEPAAVAVAVLVAAACAGVLHLYQGPRAVLIITQLSVLFGMLFVLSGYNLWAVILCHGLYDTVAFVRFAGRRSKYSRLESQA
jgi:membrane protease YdiL (CAAX protease family)